MKHSRRHVIANSRFSPRTGIGVVQSALYPRLAAMGFDIQPRGPEYDGSIGRMPRFRLLRTLFLRVRRSSVFLCVASPLPLNTPRNVVAIVHDLRWAQTRGPFSRMYRTWDLGRIVRKSSRIVCISETTQRQLLDVFPAAEPKSSVAWLGPGLAQDARFNDVQNGQLLLNGAASHKRNELLARVLVRNKPEWIRSVVGVGLSGAATDELRRGFGDAFIPYLSVSDDEMRALYEESQFFAHFGVSEGFGMPYVEALCSGCEVIAIDQPLTREILGDAAWLLLDGDEYELSRQLDNRESQSVERRRERASAFEWDSFARAIAEALNQRPSP